MDFTIIMIASREAHPPVAEQKKGDVPWSNEAEQLIGKIPQMARGMVRRMVEDFAAKNGYAEITTEVMLKAREMMH